MDGRICNRGPLPWWREPLSLQAQGEAQICRCPWTTAMEPPGTAQRGHGAESSRSRGPPPPPRSLCQRTNCASDFAVPKIAPGSGGVTSAGAAAAGLAGAGKEDAARHEVRRAASAPHRGPVG